MSVCVPGPFDCAEITLKTTHVGNTAILSHSVATVADLPPWTDNGTYIFVEEVGWLYVFNQGQWTQFVPEGPNSTGYEAYQRRLMREAKTRRIAQEEEEVMRQMQMKVAGYDPTYGKKKEPEVIGQRVYTDPYWRDIPVIFGVFGVEMMIGTGGANKEKNPEARIMARDYETDEDRIRVNISNFVLFLYEKYTRAIEFEEPNVVVYKDDMYRVSLKGNKLLVERKKRFFWKSILDATYSRHIVADFKSPMHILRYEMKDIDIPSMTDLVEKMVADMNDVVKKRIEAKEKAEREALEAKEAKKIYYDMLGI